MSFAERNVAKLEDAINSRNVPAILEIATEALDHSLLPGLTHESKRPAMRLVVGAIFAASVIHVEESRFDDPVGNILEQISPTEASPKPFGGQNG